MKILKYILLINLICISVMLGAGQKTQKVYCDGFNTQDFQNERLLEWEIGMEDLYTGTIWLETGIQKCIKTSGNCEKGYNIFVVGQGQDSATYIQDKINKINKERIDNMIKKIQQARAKVGEELYNKVFNENCKVVEFD